MSTWGFFATSKDMEPGIRRMEAEYRLKYVLAGYYDEYDIKTYKSALDIPDLGFSASYAFNLSPRYIVLHEHSEVVIETYTLNKTGKDRHRVDLNQPYGFIFQPSGWHQQKLFMGGAIFFSGAPASPELKELRKIGLKYQRYITKNYVAARDRDNQIWKIGPEAYELLQQGVKLETADYGGVITMDSIVETKK